MELGEGLKKILLAGIGTAAVTAEKSKEILDELVKKGELTVEQGKVLNQELKHNIKSTVKTAADSVKESAARKNEQEELKATISKLTPEQLAAVKARIESMQAEAAAKEEEVPVAEPVEDAATETVEEEKTEAAGGSEEAPEPGTGAGLEMDAIGGVFVGGVAATGGYGSVIGTFVGIFVIMLLKTGLPYVGLQANWQQIITGIVLIVAVLIDILKEKKAAH